MGIVLRVRNPDASDARIELDNVVFIIACLGYLCALWEMEAFEDNGDAVGHSAIRCKHILVTKDKNICCAQTKPSKQ